MLRTILLIIEIIISLALIAAILLQQRGSGLGGAFGAGSSGGVYYEKRGIEKVLFYVTIALSVAFLLIALVILRFT